MAKPGLPKKYAKYGFKKGWKLFNAAKNSRKKKTSGSTHVTPKLKGKTMAKKKRAKSGGTKIIVRTAGAPAKKRKTMGRRRAPSLVSKKTMDAIIDGGIMGATAIGSTAALGVVPVVKEWPTIAKVATQVGTGILLLAPKDKYIKKAGMGVIIGSVISLILPRLPENLKVFGGGRRKFSQAELEKIRSLGKPVNIPNSTRQLGRPMSLTSAELDTATMGRSSSRASRYNR